MGTWEQLYNPEFKVVVFDHFKSEAGLPTFVLSAKQWIEQTNAIGIYVQNGRYGGTYAHKDIAFEFGSAISPVFKLHLIREYQRLKEIEANRTQTEWDAKRFLSRANYLIHTDAIKKHMIPQNGHLKDWLLYADEADLLNIIVFGCTVKQWREANSEKAAKFNLRDFASINELTVLSNLESHNAELIKEGKSKDERYRILSEITHYQLTILNEAEKMKQPSALTSKQKGL